MFAAETSYLTMRDMILPLMSAVVETGNPVAVNDSGFQGEDNAQRFQELLTLTCEIRDAIATGTGSGEEASDRWRTSMAAAGLVASQYRASGLPTTVEKVRDTLPILLQSSVTLDSTGAPSELSGREERVQAISAMIPVLSAVTRFAFGRPEAEVLLEIVERLREEAKKLTKTLQEAGYSEVEPHRLRMGVMDVMGRLYAESHYAEMDRLLDMPQQDRAEYVQSFDNKPPMDPVWEAFSLRLDCATQLGLYFGRSD